MASRRGRGDGPAVQLGIADEYIDLTAKTVYDNAQTSKAGGAPFWLLSDAAPTSSSLRCGVCSAPLLLVVQIHAPLEDLDRALYVFACNRRSCASNTSKSWKAISMATPNTKPHTKASKSHSAASSSGASAAAVPSLSGGAPAVPVAAAPIDWGLGNADWSFAELDDPNPSKATATVTATAPATATATAVTAPHAAATATVLALPAVPVLPASSQSPPTSAPAIASASAKSAPASTITTAAGGATATVQPSPPATAAVTSAAPESWDDDDDDASDATSEAGSVTSSIGTHAPSYSPFAKMPESERFELLLQRAAAIEKANAKTSTAASTAAVSTADSKSAPAASTATATAATATGPTADTSTDAKSAAATGQSGTAPKSAPTCLVPFYLDFFAEPPAASKGKATDAELAQAERLLEQYKLSESSSGAEKDSETYVAEEYEESGDTLFLKFQRRVARYPLQDVRYAFGGEMLWLSNEHKRTSSLLTKGTGGGLHVPACESCGAPRVFELQLMPNLLTELNPDAIAADARGMEWGTVSVFVCSKVCCRNGLASEYVYVQSVL